MLVDYMELRQAREKVSELSDIIKQLRIELSESRQIARGMVQSADVSKAIEQERERCAKICETLPLVFPHPEHYSLDERHIMLMTEAGCRGAFAQAIRGGDKHE